MRLMWLLVSLFLTLLMAYLNSVALTHFLYWKYEWYDIMMHFLGGLSIASLVGALVPAHRLKLFMAFSLLAFVLWEVFELFNGVAREQNYIADTVLDVIMDSVGAVVVYLGLINTLWRSK